MRTIILFFLLVNGILAQSVSPYFTKAMSYFDSGKYLLAHQMFEKIKTQASENDDILAAVEYYDAKSLNLLGQTNGAVNEYEKFLKEFPYSSFRSEALFNLAKIYFNSDELSIAREKFILLIKEFPDDENWGKANYWAGEAFVRQNNLNAAEEFFLQALTKREEDKALAANTLFALGNLYVKKGELEKAVEYYDELLAYYRNSKPAPLAQMRIGITYFRLEDYNNAILELTDPLVDKLPPELAIRAKAVLANSYFRLKQFKKAQKLFSSLLKNKNNNYTADEIKYALAWVNFQTGKFDEAFKIFQQLIDSPEDSIRIKSLYWSAECKRYRKEINEAVKLYDLFLRMYPDNKYAYAVRFNIGVIYYNRKDYKRAVKNIKIATAAHDIKTKARALNLLGEISLDLKKYRQAKGYFEQAVNLNYDGNKLNLRALLGLGTADFYGNYFDEAVKALSELKKSDKEFEKDKVNFYLAESFFALGKFKKAKKFYDKIAPTNTLLGKQALYGRAYTYFNLKDYPNSAYFFKEYTRKFRNGRNYTDALFRLADSYFGTKNFNLAVNIYLKILKEKGYHVFSPFEYYHFAQSLYRADNRKRAIKEFKNLQILFPRSKYAPLSQYLVGWINFQSGNFEQAIKEYLVIPQKYKNSRIVPISYYSIGDSYYNLGKYDEAISFYKSVLEDFPKSKYVFDAVNGIQYCYIAKNMPESAVEFIDNYVLSNPESRFGDEIYFKKGEIYFSIGNYEKARSGYKEFIATYPNSPFVPNAYYWIAKSSENLGQTEDAVYNYKIILNKYFNSDVTIPSIIELGKIYNDRENPQEALKLYDKYIPLLKNKKGIEEVLFLRGKVLVELNRIKEAFTAFNKIIAYYRGNVFAEKSKVEAGKILLNSKQYEKAKVYFREVGENRTDDIGAAGEYYYGLTLYLQGDYYNAIPALVRVRSVFSHYDEWYTKSLLTLGDCYAKLKDKKNAREMYRAVLRRHKNDDFGKQAKRKIRLLRRL